MDDVVQSLIVDEKELVSSTPLFNISSTHFNNTLGKIINKLNIGRSNRKFLNLLSFFNVICTV